jgi:transcriptional regulator NrdR family protein
MQCPSCKSENTKSHHFDDTEPGKVMRKMYPHAKECGDCHYVWWVTVPSPVIAC